MKIQNHSSFFFVLIFLAVQTTTAQSPTKLWFDEPATYFEERVVELNANEQIAFDW